MGSPKSQGLCSPAPLAPVPSRAGCANRSPADRPRECRDACPCWQWLGAASFC